MRAIAKYILFVAILVAVVYAMTKPDLPFASPIHREGKVGRMTAGEIPPLPSKPSRVLDGLRSSGAIDYSPDEGLTATGEEGAVKLWILPDEKPVLTINAGEGAQVLQVRFVPGKGGIAGCGLTAEGKGFIKVFQIASGKQTFQAEDPEPVIYMDVDPGGRYLVATGMSAIKVWDLPENRVISVISRDSVKAKGVFFDSPYVLQSGSLSLHDWKSGKKAGALDAAAPADIKKINDKLYAWISAGGLNTLRTPYGRKEFIPFNVQGLYAFDLAPDGKWGLFLKENKTMAVIDCATGETVRTVALSRRPDSVFISQDGARAYLLFRGDKIDVYDVGSENIIGNARFYTARFFTQMRNKISDLAKNEPRTTPTVN